MSATKERLDQIQGYYQIAYDILIEIGAIKECVLHSDYYYEAFRFDEQAIYSICTNKLKEKYGANQDFKMFCDQISEIMKNAAAEASCPYCKKE